MTIKKKIKRIKMDSNPYIDTEQKGNKSQA
jgi:hypothetical protein